MKRLKKKGKKYKERISCLITYNRKLLMMCKIINKHWNFLQINPEMRETVQNNPFVSFKRNKNLHEIIGSHTIKNGRVVFKAHSKSRKRNCELCNTSKPSLWWKQVIGTTSTFQSYQKQEPYTIFHKFNGKSKSIIYLMECALWKVQYVGKAETAKIYPCRFAF